MVQYLHEGRPVRLSEKQAQILFQIAMDTIVKDNKRVIGGYSAEQRLKLLGEIMGQQNEKVKDLRR